MQIEVNGTKLFFDVEGAGLVPDGPRMRNKPSLVLLHGGPGFDHSPLKPFFSSFADIAQVIYVDQRGSGRSADSKSDSWNLPQWGDDVRAFCDALGVTRPIILGVSFGGFVAQSYATRHPDHAAGLVLVNTAARMDFPAVYAAFERMGGVEAGVAARAYWEMPTWENWHKYATICLPLYNSRSSKDDDWKRRAVVATEVGTHFNGPSNEHGRMDFRTDLKKIRCPTLVLAGGKDPITPPEFSETIAGSITPALVRLQTFETCGHPVYVDDPQGTTSALRRFILDIGIGNPI